ncbi:MAG TPA: tyrosine--tRNA ligase [Bacteroidia bacterium]|nr:tyrosine--tRNA ligase [Bacteroidia bacterium]
MKLSFTEELRWRGMLHDIMPGTEELLNSGSVSGYIGFDPTSDSLGVGNLAQIMTLLHFQKAGHKPYALVGGATGMVGDPSGKSQERNLLTTDILEYNLSCQRRQLEKFLDFTSGANAAEIVNNYDWFKEVRFLDFIRDVGKHITVNKMLAKDSVKNRMETGISFTEFSYQLVQGYDFYYLWKNKNCKLQMGGSDQWGNIVTGTELIGRMDGGEAYALTTHLVTKADGTKFGKSEEGNVWLDPNKTSPYKFYQFWMNVSDEDAKKYIRIFTLFDKEEIERLEAEHNTAPHLRILQKALAKDVTTRVHSAVDYDFAVEASELLFGRGTGESLQKLSARDIEAVFEGVPQVSIPLAEIEKGIPVIDFLSVNANIFPSKGEAKKMLAGGGIFINKEKVEDINYIIGKNNLIKEHYILAQKGKKNYYLIKTI